MTSTAAPATGVLAEPLRSRRNTWNTQVAVHAQMKPDSVAFRYRGADTTWAQLNRRIEALADALARRGVGQGDRVLVVMLNHTAYFEAVLGINAAGAIAVPVNFRLTLPEMSYIVSDSGAVAVITDAVLAPLVAAVRAQNDGLGTCIVVDGKTADGKTADGKTADGRQKGMGRPRAMCSGTRRSSPSRGRRGLDSTSPRTGRR